MDLPAQQSTQDDPERISRVIEELKGDEALSTEVLLKYLLELTKEDMTLLDLSEVQLTAIGDALPLDLKSEVLKFTSPSKYCELSFEKAKGRVDLYFKIPKGMSAKEILEFIELLNRDPFNNYVINPSMKFDMDPEMNYIDLENDRNFKLIYLEGVKEGHEWIARSESEHTEELSKLGLELAPRWLSILGAALYRDKMKFPDFYLGHCADDDEDPGELMQGCSARVKDGKILYYYGISDDLRKNPHDKLAWGSFAVEAS